MNTETRMRCLKALKRLSEKTDGDSVLITADSALALQIVIVLPTMAKGLHLTIGTAIEADGVRVTRLGHGKVRRYAALDTLEVGKSVVLDLPASEHRALRVACSAIHRVSPKRFSCEAVSPVAIKVTRRPDGADLKDFMRRRGRVRVYDFSALQAHAAVTFDVSLTKGGLAGFRSSVYTEAKRRGWILHCRAGERPLTAIVYRLDNIPAPTLDELVY